MLKIDQNFEVNSPIMEPMDSLTFNKDLILKPDVVSDADFKSIPISYNLSNNERAFLLMNEREVLCVSKPEDFCRQLGIGENDKVKVVSIFGNTGDGKSHTMNNIFFHGESVFKTSPEQNSCTIGVYAAMQPELGVLCLDTEGLLGTTTKSNQRMRMLLKILAISDIVIYRTRSERLHSDLYEFLGTASKAFCKHFAQALQSLALPGTAKTLGPAVIIFHETRYTMPLENTVNESADEKLRQNFETLNYEINAFSSLRYVGVQTSDKNKATDFSKIITTVRLELDNTAVRSPRNPHVVFKAMMALNHKFSGQIVEKPINPFPEQYFTCTVHCESCNRRCQRSMGHVLDGENHFHIQPCNYQHQFENKVYLCKTCYNNGKEIVVDIRTQSHCDSSWYGLAKYAWKGSVIDCPQCGEIYRSRQYWYGNKSPEVAAVRTEIVHVWKGGNITAKAPAHSAQIVVDSVGYVTEAISNLSAQPTKKLTGWLADIVAPSYWRPNHEIVNCGICNKNFEKTGLPKHHCRGCGGGFCNACSIHNIPVPSRGWNHPVRVCNDCYHELQKKSDSVPVAQTYTNSNHNNNCTGTAPATDEADILVRKYGETIYNTISSVASVALEYPKEYIKDSARPDYWVPDADSPNCSNCKMPFGTIEEFELSKANGSYFGNAKNLTSPNKTPLSSNGSSPNNSYNQNIVDLRRHHCRRCGQAVCHACSLNRRPVPERGWHSDVRICDPCYETTSNSSMAPSTSTAPIKIPTEQSESIKLTPPDNTPKAKKID